MSATSAPTKVTIEVADGRLLEGWRQTVWRWFAYIPGPLVLTVKIGAIAPIVVTTLEAFESVVALVAPDATSVDARATVARTEAATF